MPDAMVPLARQVECIYLWVTHSNYLVAPSGMSVIQKQHVHNSHLFAQATNSNACFAGTILLACKFGMPAMRMLGIQLAQSSSLVVVLLHLVS